MPVGSQDFDRKTTLRNLGAAVRWLAVVALLTIGAAALAFVLWRFRNPVVFAALVLLFVWAARHEWYHYTHLDTAVLILEKRVSALEKKLGTSGRWLEELEGARAARGVFGGRLSDYVKWPAEQDEKGGLDHRDSGEGAE